MPVTSQKEQGVSCPQKLSYGEEGLANHDGEGWAERQRVDVPPGSDGPMKGGPECSHLQRDASEPPWLEKKVAWLSAEVMC